MSVSGCCPNCGVQLIKASMWVKSGHSYRDFFGWFQGPGELLIRLDDGRGGGPVLREGEQAQSWYCLGCGTVIMASTLPHLRKKQDRLWPETEW